MACSPLFLVGSPVKKSRFSLAFCGGANNLVILNYDSPTPLTQDNFPGHFCYAFDARNVESVISQGRLIVDHGRLASMDEDDILAYANEQARRLWALL